MLKYGLILIKNIHCRRFLSLLFLTLRRNPVCGTKMKRRTIWSIAIVMGVCFLTLLYLQVRYFEDVMDMRREQFGRSVQLALYRSAYNLELRETQQGLKRALIELETDSADTSSVDDSLRVAHAFDLLTRPYGLAVRKNALDDKAWRGNEVRIDTSAEQLKRTVRERFLHGQRLVNEVVYNLLYEAGEKPLQERVDCEALDNDIQRQLKYVGVTIPFHIRVMTSDGREIYRCADYSDIGAEIIYKQMLFPNDVQQQMGVVAIHFPEVERYLFASVKFMMPAIAFTIVLLLVFIFTVYTIFRQKRLSEIKNDFINNMTHEFKTPLSSISLAAQMLGDDKIRKTEPMIAHLSGVIVQETKRMRFQVEKVLQMSLLEDRSDTFKSKEVDIHVLIEEAVSVFRLKVEAGGGTIDTSLLAENHVMHADPMHVTNVIFNLMDNAVKYQHPDRALHLSVSTQNKGEALVITVADNGIGIRRENLKNIFDKFYRVGHGNLHDVKGFGLGLAYVRNVVRYHKGTIRAESHFGEGSRFIIHLPLDKK